MGRSAVAWTVSGPLAPHVDAFARCLSERGFSAAGVGHRVRQLGDLSRWLEAEGLRIDELTAERQKQFLEVRGAAGCRTWLGPESLRLPLSFLCEAGIAAEPLLAMDRPVERLLAEYRDYLTRERGLVEHTICNHERVARAFLADREEPDGVALEDLSAADVSAFLARECPRRSVAGARDLIKGLRSLLRYLHVAGLISAPLQWAVPSVARRPDHSLPRGLEPAAVARLLASCDRRRTVGRRDYAVLLLLARLGLRAGEVAALRLEDVDWRRGDLVVRGKGKRLERLPLPVDVGEALVSYLRRRPRSDHRQLFLCVRAPRGPVSALAVSGIVHRACERAQLAPVNAHRLRHTAATDMLRAGASLPEVGQVLRHRQLATTAIYAKVDLRALRELARPWPGAQS